ncbi:GAF and ANTAR domain-containing protein [Microbispora hainanensis]|jgi:GAF domain-containing protein|uniref:GAF and ANTAR domain-containing protein n=1 Tax=Microbispora hainanensis TaxID=568844 RepID=A0ABZ1SUR6_9ACTN|nr:MULTISPECIES: GAF and ANTAR domain-containing protein [Microbispora]NJP29302.1 GAF and ANTAR domain-containing protein [Microbispora sp. CL1-1]TQS05689.1 GAF and ANTAR domain-containing protein [Microbispora sp. SCL1-1]
METTSILARDLAALGRVTEGTSAESVLRGITEAVARGVPGCAGGTAELWMEGRVLLAASHSELTLLIDRERDLREGPSREALSTGRPMTIPDVMRETRWSRYAATAVRHGVRSVLVVPIAVEGAVVIIGLYGVRPGVFSSGGPLMALLREQVTVALANIWEFDDVLTGAAQMQEALAGRSVIDQAKGIIMSKSGCSAEEAFDELRRVSQHHQVKVADLARLLVTEHQQKHGGAAPD